MLNKDRESDAEKIGLDSEVISPFRSDDALSELPQSGHYIRESFGVGRALERFMIDRRQNASRSGWSGS